MVNYVAPDQYPYEDTPSTDTPVLADALNDLVEIALDLGGSGGRVADIETRGRSVRGQTARSGAFLAPAVNVGFGAMVDGNLQAAPIDLAAGCTVDRIGLEVYQAATGSVLRLGIYADDPATGLPGDLLLDAGTISSATVTGHRQITISQALTEGRWWLAAVAQGGGPGVRYNSGVHMIPYFSTSEMTVAGSMVQRSAVAGALPTPFAPTSVISQGARAYLRCV